MITIEYVSVPNHTPYLYVTGRITGVGCPAERAAKEYNVLINAMKTKVLANTEELLEVMVDGAKIEWWNCMKKDASCASEVVV